MLPGGAGPGRAGPGQLVPCGRVAPSDLQLQTLRRGALESAFLMPTPVVPSCMCQLSSGGHGMHWGSGQPGTRG